MSERITLRNWGGGPSCEAGHSLSRGRQGEGLGQMLQGLRTYTGHGGRITWRPYYLSLLAKAHGRGRQHAGGARAC